MVQIQQPFPNRGGPTPIAQGSIPGIPGNLPPSPMQAPPQQIGPPPGIGGPPPGPGGPPPGGAPPGMPPGLASLMGGKPPGGPPGGDSGGGGGDGSDKSPLPPDPMQIIAQMMQQEVDRQAEADHKPIYPAWYKETDYPKPESTRASELARDDQSRHRLLLKRMAEDLDSITTRRVGVFKNFDPLTESTFRDTKLAGEFQLMQTLLGTLDRYYEAEARSPDDQDEADAKESALYYWRKEWEKAHANSGDADLNMDIAYSILASGRIVARSVINNMAGATDCAITHQLLDPATCYPIWDGERGLLTMTRYYPIRVSELLGSFNDGTDALEKKLTGDDKKHPTRKMSDSVWVAEYWDRRWYGVLFEGEWVYGPNEHQYGEVPYVYEIVAMGRPNLMRSPYMLDSVRALSTTRGDVYSADEELAEQGYSYIHFLKITHHQAEALAGRLYTEAAKAINPPIVLEQDDVAFKAGPPKISAAEGARNRIMMNREKIGPFPTAPNPAVLGPLMALSQDAYSRWTLPAEAHGMTSNTQQSGSAVESLSDAGREKMAIYLRAMTMFEIRVAELDLRLFRNWGWHLGDEGDRGTFYIPRAQARRNMPKYLKLTHGMLRRTDTRIDVRLTSLKLQNMGPLANALAIRKTNGWIEDREALRYFDVRDPDATLRRILIEKAKQEDPDFQKAMLEQALEQDGDLELLLKYQQRQKDTMMTQRFSGGPAPGSPPDLPSPPSSPMSSPMRPPMGGPPPGGMPPGGPPQPPIQFQGASLPRFGIQPGINGGRPPLPGIT